MSSRRLWIFLLVGLVGAATKPLIAQDETHVLAGIRGVLPAADTPHGQLSLPALRTLLTKTLFAAPSDQYVSLVDLPTDTALLDDREFFCIVHILTWDSKQLKPTGQRWYLYNSGRSLTADASSLRILGSKKLGLLYVHLNAQALAEPLTEAESKSPIPVLSENSRGVSRLSDSWVEIPFLDVKYTVNVTAKLPLYVSEIASLVGVAQAAPPAEGKKVVPIALWGGGLFRVAHVPSDITVVASAATATGSPQELGRETYDNEGLYRFSISVGVPVSKVEEVEFRSADGVVTVRDVEKRRVLGMVNYYFMPVDTKSASVLRLPHLVGGIALSKDPLKQLFAGLGWGTPKIHVFGGYLFNQVEKPKSLAPGDPATDEQLQKNLKQKYDHKFVVGLNLPVKTFLDLVKPKK